MNNSVPLFPFNIINDNNENKLRECSFENIAMNGNAMIQPSFSKKLSLNRCAFADLKKANHSNSHVDVEIVNCFFYRCYFDSNGGVIYMSGSVLMVTLRVVMLWVVMVYFISTNQPITSVALLTSEWGATVPGVVVLFIWRKMVVMIVVLCLKGVFVRVRILM
jgi:hypothetical protein